MPTRHKKFMREVFGPETAEDRRRRKQLATELQQQGQNPHPPTFGQCDMIAPSSPHPGMASPVGTLAPAVGAPTTEAIVEMESRIIELREMVRRFPHVWDRSTRDFLGTLWVNASGLRASLEELEADLKFFLDQTR